MPAGQAVSRFGSGIFCFTRDALRGIPCLKTVRFLFFFFVVVTNLHINFFIKLCPLLVGMYRSDCLINLINVDVDVKQEQANQNPFLSRILRGMGPTHTYLCDVKASFKPGLNFWRPYCQHVVDLSVPFSNVKLAILKQ